ncbi:MAG TPA: hypothetical protein VFB62_28720 [Polyangiaceae bacterium]|nr:hypothetical protein [Polyangiaceae bacterium]
MGGTLRRHQGAIALWIAGAFVAVAALAPLLALVSTTEGLAIWASARSWELLARSLGIAVAVTIVALAIGVPIGVLLGRTDVVGRRAAWLLHAFGMFLPPLLLALGWFHLVGSMLFNAVGLVATLGLAFAPVATSLTALGVMGVDAALEEAARVTARPWRIATRILLPAAWPAVALASIVVSVLAFSELGAPMFLRVDVFPAAVFARLGGVDYAPGEAFALILPVLLLALAVTALERRLIGRRSYAVLGLRGGSRPPLQLGRWRWPLTLACWGIAMLSIAPVAAIALRAGGLSDALRWAETAPYNSIVTAGVAATLIVAVGLVVGHAVARRTRGAAWVDALAVLVFVTPASVLGVGLIAVWNRGATELVYRTLAIVVVGFFARYAIVGVRVVAAVVAQIPIHFEEAAAASGAGYLRRLGRIVLPLGARGVAFAWLLALVFGLRDLETAVLFYPPGGEPLTVRIFTLEANGPERVVASLCLLQALITAGALALGSLLVFRRARA